MALWCQADEVSAEIIPLPLIVWAIIAFGLPLVSVCFFNLFAKSETSWPLTSLTSNPNEINFSVYGESETIKSEVPDACFWL